MPAYRSKNTQRLSLESALRHALAREELRVFYQPCGGTDTLVTPRAGYDIAHGFFAASRRNGIDHPYRQLGTVHGLRSGTGLKKEALHSTRHPLTSKPKPLNPFFLSALL